MPSRRLIDKATDIKTMVTSGTLDAALQKSRFVEENMTIIMQSETERIILRHLRTCITEEVLEVHQVMFMCKVAAQSSQIAELLRSSTSKTVVVPIRIGKKSAYHCAFLHYDTGTMTLTYVDPYPASALLVALSLAVAENLKCALTAYSTAFQPEGARTGMASAAFVLICYVQGRPADLVDFSRKPHANGIGYPHFVAVWLLTKEAIAAQRAVKEKEDSKIRSHKQKSRTSSYSSDLHIPPINIIPQTQFDIVSPSHMAPIVGENSENMGSTPTQETSEDRKESMSPKGLNAETGASSKQKVVSVSTTPEKVIDDTPGSFMDF
jgi:hypothetical protein